MYNTYYNITLLNDTIAGGVGLTDKEAAQLQTIYDHYSATLYLGMVVNVSLTGSHTNASYPTKVVYINQTSTMVHLLGTTDLGQDNFTAARADRWTATLTLGNLSYTINNCMNPTSTQIVTYCSGYQTGFIYWCNDYNYYGSRGWWVGSNGELDSNGPTTDAYGVLPYIIVNL